MHQLTVLLLFLLSLVSAQLHADRPLRVITSLGPLQLITAELLTPNDQVELLIPVEQSPHHFQLKPSHLRMVSDADLLIWISDDFETSLQQLQRNLPASAERIRLIEEVPAKLLIGDHHDVDGHLWLSPGIAQYIVGAIADRLALLNPASADWYRDKAASLSARLQSWHQKATKQVQQMQPRYILDHQFLAYFERDLELANLGSLASRHDHGGSMRELHTLHARLKQKPARCLLVNRLPAGRQAEQISQRYNLEIKQVGTLSGRDELMSITDLYDRILQILAGCG